MREDLRILMYSRQGTVFVARFQRDFTVRPLRVLIVPAVIPSRPLFLSLHSRDRKLD